MFLAENLKISLSAIIDEGLTLNYKTYHIYDINQTKEDGSNNARPKSEEQGVSPSSDNSIPQNPDSVKREDANYLKAVESGDMETAQKMVDEAGKEARYRLDQSNALWGKPEPLYNRKR